MSTHEANIRGRWAARDMWRDFLHAEPEDDDISAADLEAELFDDWCGEVFTPEEGAAFADGFVRVVALHRLLQRFAHSPVAERELRRFV